MKKERKPMFKLDPKSRRKALVITEKLSDLMIFVCVVVMCMFRLNDWGLPMPLAILIFFASLLGVGFFIVLSHEASDLIENHDKEMEMRKFNKV